MMIDESCSIIGIGFLCCRYPLHVVLSIIQIFIFFRKMGLCKYSCFCILILIRSLGDYFSLFNWRC